MVEPAALLPEQPDETAPRRPAAEITAELRAALRDRFCRPEWALFEEVGFGAGPYRSRIADGIAIHLWGGHDHEVNGFELKASRADWLREIRTVGKADPAQRFCARWWIVADRNVVKLDELPGVWGLMELAKGGRLRVKRQASRVQPEPLGIEQLVTLLNIESRQETTPEARAARQPQGNVLPPAGRGAPGGPAPRRAHRQGPRGSVGVRRRG